MGFPCWRSCSDPTGINSLQRSSAVTNISSSVTLQSVTVNYFCKNPLLTYHPAKLSHDLHGRFMGYHQPVYTSHNSTVKDQAWEAVNVGHGPVAIDTKLAQSRGLPPTRLWKPDRTKSVYLVAAYHALHCLVRKVYHKTKRSC